MRKALLAAALAVLAGGAAAQGFPSRTITLICPWPAGGPTDLHLRKVAEFGAKHLGQPVIVENRPGGSGMNGPANMTKTAKPDGYTISQLAITAFRVPHMQKVDWDPLTDFSYIIGISGYTFGIVVKADSPIKSFQDLISQARANPGTVSYGTPASITVGVLGSAGMRLPVVTASTRSLPALICGIAVEALLKKTSVWPPRRSLMAGPVPL